MTSIETYYELLHKIQISNFMIGIHAKHPDEQEDLAKEKENNKILTTELETLQKTLAQESANADEIRTALIHVANGVLSSLTKIKKWGVYYPDLSQGMVVPGYLFGKILNDFKIALKYEGGLPVVEIYMSQIKWDYEPLQSLIQNIREELLNSSFSTKMEAIDYYEQIRGSVLTIVDDFRKQGII